VNRTLIRAAACVVALSCSSVALAQPSSISSYPNKPVRVIVPFPAGGTADSIPRIVADKLTAKWGQTVVVENRPGAGGNIGADAFARSDPDGYVLLASPPGPLSINFNLYKSITYDARKFMPISVAATMPTVMVVRPDLAKIPPKELFDELRANPDKFSYASQGNGTTSHLTANLFSTEAGVRMLHVPYKGTAPALTDLIGGKVDMMFDNISSSLTFHQSGRVKIIAVAAPKRVSSLPDVPTFTELGLPNVQAGSWVAFAAPAGTPQAIVDKIAKDIAEVVRMPDVQKKFAELSADPVGDTPKEMAAFVNDEANRWGKVIKAAHVTLD
jgi:tripartite-type tricarboxylate transporter receptor subunit TctC